MVVTPPELTVVAPLRDSSRADIVVLIRPFRRNAHAACGMANRNGTVGFDMAPYEGWAYAVFSDGLDLEAGNGPARPTPPSHEIGHVMGMNHDRGSLSVDAPNATVPLVSTAMASVTATTHRAALRPCYASMPTHGDIMSIAYVNRNLNCYSHPGIRIASDGLSCGFERIVGHHRRGRTRHRRGSLYRLGGRLRPVAALCEQFDLRLFGARPNYVRVKVSRWRDAPISGTITQGRDRRGQSVVLYVQPRHSLHGIHRQLPLQRPGRVDRLDTSTRGRLPYPCGRGAGCALTVGGITSNLSAQLDSAFPNCNLDIDGNGLIDALDRRRGDVAPVFGAGAANSAHRQASAHRTPRRPRL